MVKYGIIIRKTAATRCRITRIQATLQQSSCLQNAKSHLESTKPPPPGVKPPGFRPLCTKTVASKMQNRIWSQPNHCHPVSNHPDSGQFAPKQLPPKCETAFGVNQTPATPGKITRIEAILHQNGCLKNAKPHLESTKHIFYWRKGEKG